jgi:hypothetical protein
MPCIAAFRTVGRKSLSDPDPDPEIDAQFAAYRPLVMQLGDQLGFVHDGAIERLVERAMARQ